MNQINTNTIAADFNFNDIFDQGLSPAQKARKEERQRKAAQREKLRPFRRVALFAGAVALSAVIISSSFANSAPSPKFQKAANQPDGPSTATQEGAYNAPKLALAPTEAETEPSAEQLAQPVTPEASPPDYAENPFGWEDSAWNAVESSALKHDLPVDFVSAIVQQESHGQPEVESQDGYFSFGLMQPSVKFHFVSFAPYLEQAGLLAELTHKPASELTDQDNETMFSNFGNLGSDSETYQKIVAVLCDNGANAEVGCNFLAKMRQKVAETYPEMTEPEQLKLTAMAYNGGQGAIVANLDQPTRYIENIKQYWELVSGYLEEAQSLKPEV